MELSEFHGIPWNFPFDLEKFHGIPWNFWRDPTNSMELWNIVIDKFHNWGSVFHCLLHDFMLLYIRQSISSWNIEIFQFQSNFLVPLILLKWRYSILNGGLLYIPYIYIYIFIFIFQRFTPSKSFGIQSQYYHIHDICQDNMPNVPNRIEPKASVLIHAKSKDQNIALINASWTSLYEHIKHVMNSPCFNKCIMSVYKMFLERS